MNTDFDVVIIGAGPAGCACALALEGKGLKVALIEKEVFPRDKICGDAIPGPAFKAMYKINARWGDQMKAFADKMDITSTSIFLSPKNVISYTWKMFSYNSKRIDFDHFLFQLVKKETNTVVLEQKLVQQVTSNPNYCECFFSDGSSIKGSMIVGCDGAHSVVKRSLIKNEEEGRHTIAAIRAYYKDVDGMRAGHNEAHLIKGVDGYFWIFPLQNGWANVGFGVFKSNNKNKETINIRKLLEDVTQSVPFANRFKNASLQGKVNGFPLPIWTKQKTISGNRFLLCGDAASLIEPLQGHGIDTAMWSGSFAAEQVVNCFRTNNFSEEYMKEYEKKIYDKFGKELSRNYRFMQFFIRFPLLQRMMSKIPFNQKFTDWLIKKML